MAGGAGDKAAKTVGYSNLIEKIVNLIVWVAIAGIVCFEAWTLFDAGTDTNQRENMLVFLGLVWSGLFAILCVRPVIDNYRYGDLVKQAPLKQALKQSAFRASFFIVFLYLYFVFRGLSI